MDDWGDDVGSNAPTRRGSFVSGFTVPWSQPRPCGVARPPPAAAAPTSRKAKKHRKRHVPVGPAGIWFQTQNQKERQPNGPSHPSHESQPIYCLEMDATVTQHSSVDDTQPHGLRRGDSSQSSAPLVFFSPAWTAAHCRLRLATPSCPVYWSLAEKCAALQQHLPSPFILLTDVYGGIADWTMRTQKLLVEVVTVHSVTANDRLWTVTLQDEAGWSIKAWIQPALVHCEQQQTRLIRPGMVWLLSSCTVQLLIEAEQDNGDDEESHRESLSPNENRDQGSGLGRMLLVSESNIEHSWSSEDIVPEEVYRRWLEARNTLTTDLNKAIDDGDTNRNALSNASQLELNTTRQILDSQCKDTTFHDSDDENEFEPPNDEERVAAPCVAASRQISACSLQSLPPQLSQRPDESNTSRQQLVTVHPPRVDVTGTTAAETSLPLGQGRYRGLARTGRLNETARLVHTERVTAKMPSQPPAHELAGSSQRETSHAASNQVRHQHLDPVAASRPSSVHPPPTEPTSEPACTRHQNPTRSTNATVKKVNFSQFSLPEQRAPLTALPLQSQHSSQTTMEKIDKRPSLSSAHPDPEKQLIVKKAKKNATETQSLFSSTHNGADMLDLFNEDDNEKGLDEGAATVPRENHGPPLDQPLDEANPEASTTVHGGAPASTETLFQASVWAGLDMDTMFGDD